MKALKMFSHFFLSTIHAKVFLCKKNYSKFACPSSSTLLCLKQYIQNMYSLVGVDEGSRQKLTLRGGKIELNIPEEGIVLPSGWTIQPLTPVKVNKVFLLQCSPHIFLKE